MACRTQFPRRFLLATSQAVYEEGALRQVVVEAQDGFAIPWNAVYHLAATQAAERELRARRAQLGL